MKTLALFSLLIAGSAVADEWKPLLGKDLSNWEIFVGVPHKTVEIPGMGPFTSEDGTKGTPLGLGNDPLGIFKVIEEEGQPVLHIGGQMYAGLSTKEEYENYHLSVQFKWGEKKYEPRLTVKRDSGLLIHCTGKHGAFWNVWLRSLECQVQEGDCGDFIPLAGTGAKVPLDTRGGKGRPKYEKGAPLYNGVGYTSHGPSKEKPNGEWNTVEVYTVGDVCVFVVNGTPNMVLFDTVQKSPDGKGMVPLTKGRIQIQSEAAEIFYKDIKVKSITEFPAEVAEYAKRPEGEVLKYEQKK